MISAMWKVNQAWIFHEPVDPDKLGTQNSSTIPKKRNQNVSNNAFCIGIPEYFEVIKTPMDFGTIKHRLNINYYHRLQEFIDDMSLVFENCINFNGEDSQVGKMGKNVREEFKKLYEQLNLEFYLQ